MQRFWAVYYYCSGLGRSCISKQRFLLKKKNPEKEDLTESLEHRQMNNSNVFPNFPIYFTKPISSTSNNQNQIEAYWGIGRIKANQQLDTYRGRKKKASRGDLQWKKKASRKKKANRQLDWDRRARLREWECEKLTRKAKAAPATVWPWWSEICSGGRRVGGEGESREDRKGDGEGGGWRATGLAFGGNSITFGI